MYTFKRVRRFDIFRLNKVCSILYACGKHMASKFDLHHWDNSYVKSCLIVALCALKNSIYLLYRDGNAIATFMIRTQGNKLYFEKLGTLPSEEGKGIGTLCTKKIEEIAREAECEKVTMEVYGLSQHALCFYEHRGYRVMGMKDTRKYRKILMERDL